MMMMMMLLMLMILYCNPFHKYPFVHLHTYFYQQIFSCQARGSAICMYNQYKHTKHSSSPISPNLIAEYGCFLIRCPSSSILTIRSRKVFGSERYYNRGATISFFSTLMLVACIHSCLAIIPIFIIHWFNKAT